MRSVVFWKCATVWFFTFSIGMLIGEPTSFSNFSVPPDPFQNHEVSKEHEKAWQKVLAQCTPIKPLEIWNDDTCHIALNEYFLNEPVWAYSELNYYDRRHGLTPLPVELVNSRPNILPYSYADFVSDDIPFWRDIFDGEIEHRTEQFLEVVWNPECMELSEPEITGIQEDMFELCAARELYKYATYLDGCEVGLQRLQILINYPGYSGILADDRVSVYEVVQEIILEAFSDDVAQRTIAWQRWEKGFLHAVWMMDRCKEIGYTLLPDVETSEKPFKSKSLYWRPENVRNFQRVNSTHDIILKVAAKAGDPWAIQSYPLGLFTSSDMNDDVQARYPLLMHRHYGSLTGWFRSEFSETEKARHRAKAYLILEDTVGQRNAQLKFDPTKLSAEIEYLLDGGDLKYPRSLHEILIERKQRENE